MLRNLNNSCIFAVSNNIAMEKNKTYLIKEHISGFVMLTGILKGQTFKAKNGFKQDLRFLSKNERILDNPMTAQVYVNMLNNI
jgi:hypothetical protein